MRKIIIGSLLGFAAVSGMVSCASKVYDADPKKDYKYAANPLDTSTKAVMISSMKGKVDGAWLVFSPAYYKVDDSTQIRSVFASVRNDSVYFRTFEMYNVDSTVKGKEDDSTLTGTIVYAVYDTVIKKRKEYRQTSNITMKMYLLEDKDSGMKGFLHGYLENTLPEPGNPNDRVVFDSVYFYFDKRK